MPFNASWTNSLPGVWRHNIPVVLRASYVIMAAMTISRGNDMENASNHENRSLEWWRNLASRLAFLFAASILIGSGIGFWFSGEMRSLRYDKKRLMEEFVVVVKSNETLAQENAEINRISKNRLEAIEELKIQNYNLTIKNDALSVKLESEYERH